MDSAKLASKYGPYAKMARDMLDINQSLKTEGKAEKYTSADLKMLEDQNLLGQDFQRFTDELKDMRRRGGSDDPGKIQRDWYNLVKRAERNAANPRYEYIFEGAGKQPSKSDFRPKIVMPDAQGRPQISEAYAGVLRAHSRDFMDKAYGDPVDQQGRAVFRGGETDLTTPKRWEDKVEALQARIFPALVSDKIQASAESPTDVTEQGKDTPEFIDFLDQSAVDSVLYPESRGDLDFDPNLYPTYEDAKQAAIKAAEQNVGSIVEPNVRYNEYGIKIGQDRALGDTKNDPLRKFTLVKQAGILPKNEDT